ncbi:MAG: protein kinase [Labilithrix sp.]
MEVEGAPLGMGEGDDCSSTVVEGYELHELAGQGAMGVVYRAVRIETGELVALKILTSGSERERIRWKREVGALAAIESEAIVRLLAYGELPDARLWLAMSWVEGETLAARLRRSRLSEREARALLPRLAEGLAAIHGAGIVHRDLKPANILLPEGRVDLAMIADFGLARTEQDPRATVTGTQIGTPAYMAPEVARGERVVAPAADVFSLGAVFYEAIAGRAPFPGGTAVAVLARILTDVAEPIRVRARWVPPGLDRLLGQMLRRAPGERPADGAGVVTALENALTESSVVETEPAVSHWERRPVTVLLARSMRGAAANDATESVGGQASSMAARFGAICEPFGGRTEVFADGTLFVVFSRSTLARDQAMFAGRAALALRAQEPDLRVVLSSGRVLAPEGGDEEVSGDAAVHAFTLLESTTSGVTRLDEVTANLLGQGFVLASTDAGVELVGERPEAASGQPVRGRMVPCVGRELELATLDLVIGSVVAARVPRGVLVLAPAGAGKSRLRQELVRRLEGTNRRIIPSRSDPLAMEVPFALLADIAPPIRELLREEHAAERAAVRNPFSLRQRIVQETAAWLRESASGAPLVLVLDDLHWSDGPSVEVLDEAFALLEDAPIALAAFARPEVKERHSQALSRLTQQEIRLPKLDARAAECLLQAVLDGEGIPPEVLEQLVAVADGNALFLEELARAVPANASTAWFTKAPRTVLTLLEERCAAQPPAERRLLRAASVLGVTFARDILEVLVQCSENAMPVDTTLHALVRAELVAEGERGRYRFRHPLVREAAYALLPEEDRMAAHARVLAIGAARKDTSAAELAEHARQARLAEETVVWSFRAAEESFAANDMVTSVGFVRRALEADPSSEVRGAVLALGSIASFFAGDLPNAHAWGIEAMRLAPRDSPWWIRCAGNMSAILSHVDPARRTKSILDEGYRALLKHEPGPDEWESFCESLAITLNCEAGFDGELTAQLTDRLLYLVTQAPPTAHAARGWAHHGLAWAALFVGRFGDTGVAHAEAALEAFERAADLRNQLASHAVLGVALAARNSTAALEASASAIAIGSTVGGGFPLIYARLLRSLVIARLALEQSPCITPALLAEAEAHARFAIEVLGISAFVRGYAETVLASLAIVAGDAARANRHSESAFAALCDLVSLADHTLAVSLLVLASGHPIEDGAARIARARARLARTGPYAVSRPLLERALLALDARTHEGP